MKPSTLHFLGDTQAISSKLGGDQSTERPMMSALLCFAGRFQNLWRTIPSRPNRYHVVVITAATPHRRYSCRCRAHRPSQWPCIILPLVATLSDDSFGEVLRFFFFDEWNVRYATAFFITRADFSRPGAETFCLPQTNHPPRSCPSINGPSITCKWAPVARGDFCARFLQCPASM